MFRFLKNHLQGACFAWIKLYKSLEAVFEKNGRLFSITEG